MRMPGHKSVELESLSKTNRRIGELRREISALGAQHRCHRGIRPCKYPL